MATDPVCGMSVDEADAPAEVEHKGTTYYFCSTDCREEFDANPEDYESEPWPPSPPPSPSCWPPAWP